MGELQRQKNVQGEKRNMYGSQRELNGVLVDIMTDKWTHCITHTCTLITPVIVNQIRMVRKL